MAGVTLNEERLMFHREHSVAITQWTHIEQSLATLAAAGVPLGNASAGIANAFFGIESFRSKLEFVDRFIQRLLLGRSALLSEWAAIKGRLETSAAARNKLAHWRLVSYAEAKPSRRYVLEPPGLNPSSKLAAAAAKAKGKSPPTTSLGVLEVVRIRHGIFVGHIEIQNFHARAAGQAEPFVGEFVQPLKVPSLRDLRRELFENLGIPVAP